MSRDRVPSTRYTLLPGLREEPPSLSEEIEEIRKEETDALIWYQTLGGKWRIKIRRT